MFRCSLLVFVCFAVSRTTMCQQCDGTPCDCSQPDVVDCSGRGLRKIPTFRNYFSGRLKLMNFSNNYFETFDPNDFGFHFIGVSTIEVLDLSNNQLTSIANSFAKTNMVPSYDKLDLSSNNFTAFPGKALPLQFSRVDLEIDISNNQLTSLPMHFVANNVMNRIPLLTLTARNNLIDHIHPLAFAGDIITELRLDLINNQLTNISEDFFFPVSQNREFKMSGNPWNCDCNFRWILTSDFREMSSSSPPLCNDPLPLRTRNLFYLSASDFVCSPQTDGVREEITVTKGDNFFMCPVTADPQSSLDITWSFSMSCQSGSKPLKITVESNEVAIKNVTCFPQSNVTCTAENYAGSIEIDLSTSRAASVEPCYDDNDIKLITVTHRSDGAATYSEENIVSNMNTSRGDDQVQLLGRDTGNSGGNGWFVFLILLVVLSILVCVALGAYYIHLWKKLKVSEEFPEYFETYTAFSSTNNCTISPIKPRRLAPPPPIKKWSEC
ncbi:Protein slit [Holothuria leucospilota]|uniref:Protein slit n=1 Tax=Holothuria leucospilota TaxID=206669 RepID=A0A9Q0YHA5_HOLLE|nr:Protein slit [Holothuria leucospilota]